MAVYFCLPICPFVQILSRYSRIVGGGGGGGGGGGVFEYSGFWLIRQRRISRTFRKYFDFKRFGVVVVYLLLFVVGGVGVGG